MALKWFDDYSGQTVEELLSLEGEYRIDSLVLACEQAVQEKAIREGDQSVTSDEFVILAIEALEREVNNGGYQQFFANSSRRFAPMIVQALLLIDCPKTAETARRALEALGLPALSVETIDAAMAVESSEREQVLNQCDDSYYKTGEDIAAQLFVFLRAHKSPEGR